MDNNNKLNSFEEYLKEKSILGDSTIKSYLSCVRTIFNKPHDFNIKLNIPLNNNTNELELILPDIRKSPKNISGKSKHYNAFRYYIKYIKNELKENNNEIYEGELKERKFLSRTRNKSNVNKCKAGDNYTCQGCGFNYKNKIVECHHLEPLSMTGESIVTIDMLITLCPNCHRLAHLLLNDNPKFNTIKDNLIKSIRKELKIK